MQNQIIDLINQSSRVLILSHIRADGDAIASVCFFIHLMGKMTKTAIGALHDLEIDPKYRFLSGFEKIKAGDDLPNQYDPDLIIVTDTPTIERLGRTSQLLKTSVPVINIDHHISNNRIGLVNWVDPRSSSTCEMLYELMQRIDTEPDSHLAQILYTGICFDTGRFRFSNTGPQTFLTASRLVALGAQPDQIADRLFYQWSTVRIKVMAAALENFTFHMEGRVAITNLNNKFFSTFPDSWRELEGISDIGSSIAGVEISIFCKEYQPGRHKLSLRSSSPALDVDRLARQFGGGGHPQAAGCEIPGSFDNVRKILLERLESLFSNNSETRTV